MRACSPASYSLLASPPSWPTAGSSMFGIRFRAAGPSEGGRDAGRRFEERGLFREGARREERPEERLFEELPPEELLGEVRWTPPLPEPPHAPHRSAMNQTDQSIHKHIATSTQHFRLTPVPLPQGRCDDATRRQDATRLWSSSAGGRGFSNRPPPSPFPAPRVLPWLPQRSRCRGTGRLLPGTWPGRTRRVCWRDSCGPG